MTKLTKAVKEQIIQNSVIKSGLIDEYNKIVRLRAEWANNVRLFAIGGVDEEKKLVAINEQYERLYYSVPEVLQNSYRIPAEERTSIYVNIAGISFRANFHGELDLYVTESVCRISPTRATLLADNPLVAEFHEIHNQQEEYDNKLSNLKNSIAGVIEKITTVKKLLDVWPEAKELLPDNIEKQVVNLPAVQTADLNTMIGLPSEDK